MKQKLFLIAVLTTALSIGLFLGYRHIGSATEYIPPSEQGSIDVYFCPRDNCEEILVNLIDNSDKADCAFYDLDSDKIIGSLKGIRKVRLVSDKDNKGSIKDLDFSRFDTNGQLMHNKFCILSEEGKEVVLTGSLNPTKTGLNRNKNNLAVIESRFLAENYKDEFNELWKGDFGSGKKVKYPKIMFNGYLIENYFCPEDLCESRVIDLISSAKDRVYFMVFSFTSDEIGKVIIGKHGKGLKIKGLFEGFQNDEFSEYKIMKENGLNVKLDNDPSFLHHKVFIVDDSVVFGSYNPTKSGNENNDENILIVHNKEITDKFLNEFNLLFENGK